MARSLTTDEQNALNNGTVDFRYCIAVDVLGTEHFLGNHTLGEILTATVDGISQDFLGVGGLLAIESLTTASGTAVDEATITVDGGIILTPPTGYSSGSSFLRTLLADDLINSPISMYEIHESTETGAVTAVFNMFAGYIDAAPLDLSQPKLTVRSRSARLTLGWGNGRTRSNADQHRIDADDDSLRFVHLLEASQGKLAWGFTGGPAPGSTVGRTGVTGAGARRRQY